MFNKLAPFDNFANLVIDGVLAAPVLYEHGTYPQHPLSPENQKQLVVQPNCVQQTVQIVVLPLMK